MKPIPKGELLHFFRTISSGTVAHIIGCNKYVIIDRAISRAMEYVINHDIYGELNLETIAKILKTANA